MALVFKAFQGVLLFLVKRVDTMSVVLSPNDKRLLFELHEKELITAKRICRHKRRCKFVVLFGYFNAKSIVEIPGVHQE